MDPQQRLLLEACWERLRTRASTRLSEWQPDRGVRRDNVSRLRGPAVSMMDLRAM